MTVKLKWLGTASFILSLNGVSLLFDPFFSRNDEATPKLKTQKEDIKNISAIFISHGHYDHVCDAGWFAENLDTKIYCSEVARKNIINWAEGKIIKDRFEKFTERAKNNINVMDFHDKIIISEDITVELIKSEHIKFDISTILSRVFSRQFLKQAKSLIPYGKGFPKGKVFGFCTYFNGIRIVSFGSLWHKFIEELKNYQNCEIFLVPTAGNSKKHLAKKAGKMVEYLNPKIVIPYHWDNFFPPISRTENLEPFLKLMSNKYSSVKVLLPKFDEEMVIDI